jgi:general secretion pathway protein C
MARVTRWMLNGLLLAVGCLLAVDTASDVIAATRRAPPPEHGERASVSLERERGWADRQVILERNLFGSRTRETAGPSGRPDDLEKSRLPLALLGTFAANESSLSRATLRDTRSQGTLVVGIGDRIEDQADVVGIERRRVVLRENGALRELALEEGERVAARVIRGDQASASPPEPPRAAEFPVELPDETFARGESEHPYINRLLEQGQLLPKFDGTRMVGVQVSGVRAGSFFDRVGLDEGDVITELDGATLDSPTHIASVMEKLSGADEAQLVVRRADGAERVWDLVPDGG